MTNDHDRLARQRHVFTDTRREETVLAIVGAYANPHATRALLAGAAPMGVPRVASDCSGRRSSHWFFGDYQGMVETLFPGIRYDALDPDAPGRDIESAFGGASNACCCAVANDVGSAGAAIEDVMRTNLRTPVYLMLTTAAGLLVLHAGAAKALDLLGQLPVSFVHPGPMEFGFIAAGLVLQEIIQGQAVHQGMDPTSVRTVGFYSLRRQRRVTMDPGESPAALWAEVSAPPPDGTRPAFTGHRLVMIGAGALGNWSAIPLVAEGAASLAIYDGDLVVEPHNLNRQVFLVNWVGVAPKAKALASELAAVHPSCRCSPFVRRVESPSDLEGLSAASALVCVPDNDGARAVGCDAAVAAGIPYATAGSSALGGQAIVCRPGHACYRCVVGAAAASAGVREEEEPNAPASCRLAANDAVVSSNMVAAGLMLSELREALAGRPTANVRFVPDARSRNQLVKMISNPACPHAEAAQQVA